MSSIPDGAVGPSSTTAGWASFLWRRGRNEKRQSLIARLAIFIYMQSRFGTVVHVIRRVITSTSFNEAQEPDHLICSQK